MANAIASLRARIRADPFAAAVLAAAALYVGLAWTPSSYGRVLAQVGAPGAGLVLGEPREIRSDEWALWTPLFQATVNNGFGRFNETSVYREDLRNLNGLPLADWSLAFKPYFWPFFFASPARAFSFYHAFWIALFLLGYRRLLRSLGATGPEAALASVLLFFTGFVQTWWTTLGPVLAGFPWLLALATVPLRPAPRLLLAVYVAAAWLFAHLYPPTLITLAFTGAVILLAFQPGALRPSNLWAPAAGTALGAGLVGFYLREAIPAVAGTVFPGGRISAGGAGAAPLQWLAQVFPFFATSGFEPLLSWNVCEASTVGSYLPLLTLAFLDPAALRRRWRGASEPDRRLRRQIAVLAGGVVLASLWILAPLPPAAGWPLLWHRVPANRMWFACGLLLLLAFLRILGAAPPKATWPRGAAAALCVLAAWLASEHALAPAHHAVRYDEFWVLAPLALALALRARLGAALPAALIACAALSNALVFGSFNPVQSARPIFERPATPVTQRLDRLAASHPRGWLVVDGAYGAWLNGWGYRSVTHALLAPHPDFFRPFFPAIPAARFEQLFNRTLLVSLTPAPQPYLSGDDLMWLPLEAFDPPRIPVEIERARAGAFEERGLLGRRQIFRSGDRSAIVLRGWADLGGVDAGSRLRVQTDLPLHRAAAYPSIARVPAAAGAGAGDLVGFAAALTGDADVAEALRSGFVRVISVDPERGSFALAPDSRP